MYQYAARVKRVLDGDTLEVDIFLGFGIITRQKIRLARINAPEMRGLDKAKAIKGQKYVKNLFNRMGHNCFIDSIKKGKYRYVAELYWFEKGNNISDMIVKAGHAEYYPKKANIS